MSKSYHEFTYTAPIHGGLPVEGFRKPGSGPHRLLIIPGSPSRKYTLRRMMASAPDELEVISIIRPGYSRGHEPVFDFDDQVEALRPLIETNDGKKTITLGISYGAELALKAGLTFPDYVSGVMSVAGLITEPRALVRGALPLSDIPGIHHLLPKYLKTARQEIANRRPQLDDVFDRLGKLCVPVTVLHGNVDHLVSRQNAKHLMAKFRSDQDVIYNHIPGGTHFMEMQMPRRLYSEVNNLIARIP